MITKFILIEKDVYKLKLTSPYPERQNLKLWMNEIKEDWITVDIARRIILKNVNNEITFKIMDLENRKEIEDKLTSIYSEKGQEIVYSIF